MSAAPMNQALFVVAIVYAPFNGEAPFPNNGIDRLAGAR
jgi:hypothetical protein